MQELCPRRPTPYGQHYVKDQQLNGKHPPKRIQSIKRVDYVYIAYMQLIYNQGREDQQKVAIWEA